MPFRFPLIAIDSQELYLWLLVFWYKLNCFFYIDSKKVFIFVNRIYYFHLYLFEHSCPHRWSEGCVWEWVEQIACYWWWWCPSLALVEMQQEMIVAQGLPIKCGTIFFIGFSDLCYVVIFQLKVWEAFLLLQWQNQSFSCRCWHKYPPIISIIEF